MKTFFAKILSWEGTKIISFSLAALMALTGGGASGYYIYGAAKGKAPAPSEEPEKVEIAEEIRIEEPEPKEEIVEEEFVSNRLYLVSSSVEKDLKITVVDDTGFAVTGIPFDVYVSSYKEGDDADFLAEVTRQEVLKEYPEDEWEERCVEVPLVGDVYTDTDADGIIAIEDMSGGEYKVALGDVGGYNTAGALMIASVNETIEYKVVDVSSRVKSETQVNATIEDTAKKNVVEEGGTPDISGLLGGENKASEDVAIEVKKKNVNEDIVALFSGSTASGMSTVTAIKKAKDAETTPGNTAPIDPTPGSQTPSDPTPPPSDPTPAPSDTTPPPSDTTPAPGDTTPPPSDTTPTPGDTTPAPGDTTPAPGDTTPTPGDTTPAPSDTMPLPSDTMPLPSDTTPDNTAPSSSGDGGAVPTAATRLGLSRVGTAAGNDIQEATVSIPETMKLIFGLDDSDDNAELKLTIKDEHSIIDTAGITWKSSDEKVVKVAASKGGTVTLAPEGKGSATITATVPYDNGDKGDTLTLSCKIKATEVDPDEKLTDSDGNILYLDKELKKEATIGDYEKQDVFYRRDNATVSVASGSVGVDVSKWNGSINWGAVAKSGISFAIVRCGYRGSATGALIEDPTYAANIQGAKSAGLKVGIYMFTQAVNEAEAVEEASMAVAAARRYGINMPIYIDTEPAGGRADGLSASERTTIIKAFCKTVSSAGFAPGVYASKNWYNERLVASELSGYNIWVAQYAAACSYGGRYNMWQYTSKGSVPGISGSVDMDIYY